MTNFQVRWGGWGMLKNEGNPSNGGMILKWGIDTLLWTMGVVPRLVKETKN